MEYSTRQKVLTYSSSTHKLVQLLTQPVLISDLIAKIKKAEGERKEELKNEDEEL